MEKFNFELGIQDPSVSFPPIPSYGNTIQGIKSIQSRKAFPSPKYHNIKVGMLLGIIVYFLIIIFITAYYYFYLEQPNGPLSYSFIFIMPLIFLVPILLAYIFLFPILDRRRAKKGVYKAKGIVIAVDNAGIVMNENAQQRALVKVIYLGDIYLLVANQNGLFLKTGTQVNVSWKNRKSQLCYIHQDSLD